MVRRPYQTPESGQQAVRGPMSHSCRAPACSRRPFRPSPGLVAHQPPLGPATNLHILTGSHRPVGPLIRLRWGRLSTRTPPMRWQQKVRPPASVISTGPGQVLEPGGQWFGVASAPVVRVTFQPRYSPPGSGNHPSIWDSVAHCFVRFTLADHVSGSRSTDTCDGRLRSIWSIITWSGATKASPTG